MIVEDEDSFLNSSKHHFPPTQVQTVNIYLIISGNAVIHPTYNKAPEKEKKFGQKVINLVVTFVLLTIFLVF